MRCKLKGSLLWNYILYSLIIKLSAILFFTRDVNKCLADFGLGVCSKSNMYRSMPNNCETVFVHWVFSSPKS